MCGSAQIGVSACVLTIALVVYIVGYGAPAWFDLLDNQGTAWRCGIWQACNDSTCININLWSLKPDWLEIVQILATVGLGALLVSHIVSTVFVFRKKIPHVVVSLVFITTSVACGTITGAVGHMGAQVMAQQIQYTVDYSFALALTGALFTLMAVCLTGYASLCYKRFQHGLPPDSTYYRHYDNLTNS